jgi:hypothetical protein
VKRRRCQAFEEQVGHCRRWAVAKVVLFCGERKPYPEWVCVWLCSEHKESTE